MRSQDRPDERVVAAGVVEADDVVPLLQAGFQHRSAIRPIIATKHHPLELQVRRGMRIDIVAEAADALAMRLEGVSGAKGDYDTLFTAHAPNVHRRRAAGAVVVDADVIKLGAERAGHDLDDVGSRGAYFCQGFTH